MMVDKSLTNLVWRLKDKSYKNKYDYNKLLMDMQCKKMQIVTSNT